MKVLLVNGSPHKDGCTNEALKEVSRILEQEGIETEIFWIENKPIGGCIACKSCRTTKVCAYGDIVNVFYEKAKSADGFIFGSPVHYAGISGNMTAFMDRLFYCDQEKVFFMKPVACVLSARRGGTTAAYDQMNKYFGISQMPIVSTSYWNMVHGSKKEDVHEDKEGMQAMRNLARNMAFLLKCIQNGVNQGISYPENESQYRTDFIR